MTKRRERKTPATRKTPERKPREKKPPKPAPLRPDPALAGPVHRHSREDEYSFVLEGRMGALLGDEVIYAGPGDLAFKPGNQWHTFWNDGDSPCRVLEIISPGGFEHFFEQAAAAIQAPDFTPSKLGMIGAQYGLELELDSLPRICAEHGLDHPLLHI